MNYVSFTQTKDGQGPQLVEFNLSPETVGAFLPALIQSFCEVWMDASKRKLPSGRTLVSFKLQNEDAEVLRQLTVKYCMSEGLPPICNN